MNYIERYWRDATPQDAIKDPPMVARFRNHNSEWSIQTLNGYNRKLRAPWGGDEWWYDHCQVYDAPDPGEGWRTEPKTSDCPDCDGTGEVHSHNSKCPTCSGKGIASSDKIDRLDEQTDGRFPAGKSGIYRRW